MAEEKKCGQLQAPKKPDRKCMIQLDEHQKYLIRKTVHSFFSANKIPTCELSIFVDVTVIFLDEKCGDDYFVLFFFKLTIESKSIYIVVLYPI
jgi:hypothetical protein